MKDEKIKKNELERKLDNSEEAVESDGSATSQESNIKVGIRIRDKEDFKEDNHHGI